MNEDTLEFALLSVVQDIRALEHRLRMLRSRDNANSRSAQSEFEARLDERRRQLAILQSRRTPTDPSS